jgi:acyl carrier protein
MTTEQKIRQFIVEELNWDGTPDELGDDYPLLDGGAVDSLGIFQIISWLESDFAVDIQDEDIVPENFGTINDIASFIASKRASLS